MWYKYIMRTNVILAPYTTYKIGGPADYFFEAHSVDEISLAVAEAQQKNVPYLVLGSGANVLVRDKGYRGIVILNRADKFEFDGNVLRAESGAVLADLIGECQKRGLSGLEHFAGIPSTLGGALWQNVHFLSPDRKETVYIADLLESADLLDKDGTLRTVGREAFNFGYDQSLLRDNPELVAVRATLKLMPLDPNEIAERIKANLEWRAERQPDVVEFPSCGSVFKKIEGVGAGRLIDKAGLKGHRIGGAQISEQHANFIVNRGGATAADVIAMIKLVQEKVKETTGYDLEPEIRLIGEN